MRIIWIEIKILHEYIKKRIRNGISSNNLPKGFNIRGTILTGQTRQH